MYTRTHPYTPEARGCVRVQNFGGISRLREKVNAFSGWARAGNGACTILPFLRTRIPRATDQTYDGPVYEYVCVFMCVQDFVCNLNMRRGRAERGNCL